MIYYANCKINLGLSVTGPRPDGFHNIESLLYPVPWNDIVEVVPKKKFLFSTSGLKIDIEDKENLCVKAYQLIKNEYDIPPVHIHLHKIVPFGTGLGGGSSDAVAVVKLLNELFSLEIDKAEMKTLVSRIGSDCTFFVENEPVMVKGRGELMEKTDVDLSGYFLVIAIPGIHISTKEAYENLDRYGRAGEVEKALKNDMRHWRNSLKNSFEAYAFSRYPELKEVKETLYDWGALYASMTGSGSAVYGIFDKAPAGDKMQNAEIKILKL